MGVEPVCGHVLVCRHMDEATRAHVCTFVVAPSSEQSFGPGYKHTWKKEPSFSSTAFARLVARVEGLAVPFDTTTQRRRPHFPVGAATSSMVGLCRRRSRRCWGYSLQFLLKRWGLVSFCRRLWRLIRHPVRVTNDTAELAVESIRHLWQ
jgi:hypothetical protein